MTAALLLIFLAAMAAVVIAIVARYFGHSTALGVSAGLAAWFVYVGLLGWSGVAANATMRLPGVVFVVGPVALFLIVFILRMSARESVVMAIPLWIVLFTQCFRIGVELLLHRMWIDGVVPRMLTFRGANVDIYIGASAPIVAWLSTRGRWGLRVAFGWNVLGLCALANVVLRSVLTSAGPLHFVHAEVANRMMGMFPYLFVPAFFVPLAVVLHVLAMRATLVILRRSP